MRMKAVVIQKEMSRAAIEVSIALLGGCFLAVLSQVAFPLAFTPIPVTLQTLALFVLAGVLGSGRAVSSVIAYLSQGFLGLPVFAGGVANPLWFFDIKAGFLVSFIAAAFLIGKMIEKRTNPKFLYLLFALTVGQLVIFIIGAGWLSFFVGVNKAFVFGVVPFIGGAVFKILAAALVLKGRSICFSDK